MISRFARVATSAGLLTLAACASVGCGDAQEGDEDGETVGRVASEVGVGVPPSLDLDKRKILYLTFDDGPHPAFTPRILDTLARHQARATFFLTGGNIAGNEAIVRREAAEGHYVANHQWRHVVASESEFRSSVVRERDLIKELTPPSNPLYFRYPYGDGTRSKEQFLISAGYRHGGVGWDIDTLDWCFAAGRCNRAPGFATDFRGWVFDHASSEGGGVVLMHDIQEVTAVNLDAILTRFERAGFRFGTLPPGERVREVVGARFCPPGTRYEAAVGFCTDATHAYGPFPEEMVRECGRFGGGSSCFATHTMTLDGVTFEVPRWAKVFAARLHGTGTCPVGTSLEPSLGYCVEGTNAFGPFEASLVTTCRERQGGAACFQNRWAAPFLRSLL